MLNGMYYRHVSSCNMFFKPFVNFDQNTGMLHQGVTGISEGCYKSVRILSQEYYRSITKILEEYIFIPVVLPKNGWILWHILSRRLASYILGTGSCSQPAIMAIEVWINTLENQKITVLLHLVVSNSNRPGVARDVLQIAL